MLLLEGGDVIQYLRALVELVSDYLQAGGWLSVHVREDRTAVALDFVEQIQNRLGGRLHQLNIVVRSKTAYLPGIAAFCSVADLSEPTAFIRVAKRSVHKGRPPLSRWVQWVPGPEGAEAIEARRAFGESPESYRESEVRVSTEFSVEEASRILSFLRQLKAVNSALKKAPASDVGAEGETKKTGSN